MTMKLTSLQEYLYDWVKKSVDENKEYFYCECAPDGCKPFKARTVFSLIDKGLIQLVEGGDMKYHKGGVYFLTLNKSYIREQRLKKILKKEDKVEETIR